MELRQESSQEDRSEAKRVIELATHFCTPALAEIYDRRAQDPGAGDGDTNNSRRRPRADMAQLIFVYSSSTTPAAAASKSSTSDNLRREASLTKHPGETVICRRAASNHESLENVRCRWIADGCL